MNRWTSNLRTPRTTIEEENVDAGDSANVDDLLPDRGGVDLPADTFNDGEVSTEAELLEFAEDVEMKPVEEAEVPAGKGVDTQKKDEVPGPKSPSVPISHAPKYTDDDGDLRDTAATPRGASTQESRGGVHNYVNTPYPEHPGEAPELKPAEVRHFKESGSYHASRGSRTSARPAEHRSNRRYIVHHVLAREAGEPFMYAVIRNKAINREYARVTAEEWRRANETAHLAFPTRDSEWDAVLNRAVHNDYMYGAIDANRAAGRIDLP